MQRQLTLFVRPVAVDLDEEELQALIDFQLTMSNDALESGERLEWKRRQRRAGYLTATLDQVIGEREREQTPVKESS